VSRSPQKTGALRAVRAAWRLLRVVLLIGQGVLLCALLFPWRSPAQRLVHVSRWCARVLRALGITWAQHGLPRPGPVLLVANHVSWLDILAINAVHPARFVSKADVRQWPVLGWLVACGGTLFIERERKRDAMRVVHLVAEALQAGDVMAVFPEGTTSDGHGLLPFHANLLQAAISVEAPLQAIALRYSDATEAVSQAAAFVGDTTLVQSLWWTVMAQDLHVRITMLPPTGTRHADRRSLGEQVRQDILAVLESA
jgi:1-acyl-sn-glycerol-3-phosphate acyltransferase